MRPKSGFAARAGESGSITGLLSMSAGRDRVARTADFLLGRPGSSTVGFAALTLGDLVYDALRVDPSLLRATDFVHAARIGDPATFAVFADRILSSAPASMEGHVHQLKGYVAERFAAQQLQSMGMEVEFPADPNQPGIDLLVNGDPFQVKCLADPDGVLEHLVRYPDVPVLVNEELASALQGVPGVYAVDGLSLEAMEETTREGLEAGADMLDLEIPTIATAVALGRNGLAVLAGRSDVRHGAVNTATDVVGSVVGGKAGAVAFAAAGALLAPYAVVVGGVVGAVAGSAGGRRFGRGLRAHFGTRRERADAKSAASEVARVALDASIDSERVFARKEGELRSNCAGTELAPFVGTRLDEESREFERARAALRAIESDPRETLKSETPGLLVTRRVVGAKVHPNRVRRALSRFLEALDSFHERQRRWS